MLWTVFSRRFDSLATREPADDIRVVFACSPSRRDSEPCTNASSTLTAAKREEWTDLRAGAIPKSLGSKRIIQRFYDTIEI